MTKILVFSVIILLFFLFEGGFFLQNSIIFSYNFLFSNTREKPQIIFGGGYIFSDVLYLNKGEKDGVKNGDLIIYDSNIAIGKLAEIFPNHSKVIPFSKFGVKNPFRTGNQKRILFEGLGNGGGEIFADFPNSLSINVGDGIWLAENQNYLVGIIENVEKKEGRDFQKISVRIPVSFKSITEVDIINSNVES